MGNLLPTALRFISVEGRDLTNNEIISNYKVLILWIVIIVIFMIAYFAYFSISAKITELNTKNELEAQKNADIIRGGITPTQIFREQLREKAISQLSGVSSDTDFIYIGTLVDYDSSVQDIKDYENNYYMFMQIVPNSNKRKYFAIKHGMHDVTIPLREHRFPELCYKTTNCKQESFIYIKLME